MALWPHQKDIDKSIESFEDFNFLSDSKDKIKLMNYLVEYVSETLEPLSKKDIFTQISVFYTEFLKTLYEYNGAIEWKRIQEQTYPSREIHSG